ncbi:MAG: hypothetical protein AAGC71_14490 [Pseudomonadota bacterium]
MQYMNDIACRSTRRITNRCALVALAIYLGACGGGGGGGGAAPTPPPPPANSPPTLLGNLSPTFPENAIVSFVLSVDDADGDTVTVTIGNSADGQFFTLDTSSGEIRSTQAFDFETPLDTDADNVYEQTVTLSDGTNTVNRTVRVIITNVDEPPTCLPVADTAIDENATGPLVTFAGTDPDAGDEAIAIFEDLMVLDMRVDGSVAIDPSTGVVSLTSPLDAEAFDENFTFDVTANYRTNNLFDQCRVTVALNDIPTRVTSGILFTNNKQPVQTLTDLNSDGVADFWMADEPGLLATDPITGTLVFGETLNAAVQASGAATIDVSALSASEAIRLTVAFDRGQGNANSAVVQTINDLDGDGTDELLVMTAQPPNDGLDPARRPWGYVVFAATIAAETSGTLDLNALGTTDGFSLTGPVDFNGFLASYAVADFDGIAGDELIISTPEGMPAGSPEQGVLYVVAGTTLDSASGNLDFDLDPATKTFGGDLDPDARLTIGPPTELNDLTGDGISELVLQSRQAAAVIPSANLIAAASGPITALNPLLLSLGDDFSGVIDTANLDNDSDDELLIVRGDGSADTEQASVVFGDAIAPIAASNTTVAVDAANFSAGQYLGITSSGSAGSASTPVTLTRIGDLDGDGRDEVAYGLFSNAGNTPGSIYIVRGSVLADRTNTSFDVDGFTAADGTRIAAVPFLFTSLSTQVSLTPDIDGDGQPELYVTSNQRLQGDPPGLGAIVFSSAVSAALVNNELAVDMETLFFDETP